MIQKREPILKCDDITWYYPFPPYPATNNAQKLDKKEKEKAHPQCKFWWDLLIKNKKKKKEIWWDRVDLSRGPIKKPERICRHLDERIHFGNFDQRSQKILKEGGRHPIQYTLKSLSPIAGSSNYVTMAKKKKEKENSSEFMFLAGPTRMWNSWLLCSSIEEMAPARMQKEARAAAS